MKSRFAYIFLAAVVFAVFSPTLGFAADTLYVAPWGNDTTGVGSYDNPYRSIGYSIWQFSVGGVLVARPGVYNEQFSFPSAYPVELRSEKGPDETIIDGAGLGTPIFMSIPLGADVMEPGQVTTHTLDGFTITCTNCDFDNGPAIEINGLSPIIRNNKIVGNVFDTSSSGSQGGGIRVDYSGASPVIYNNIIAGNSAYQGGGIYVGDFTYPHIYNNTFVGNLVAEGYYGAGIEIQYNGSADIRNNIIAFNETGWGLYNVGLDPVSIMSDNLIFGNQAGAWIGGTYSDTSGLVYIDPAFINWTTKDFRLSCKSPAFNIGDIAVIDTLTDIDLAGHPRIAHGGVDLGAFEFIDDAKVANFTASLNSGCLPLTVDFTNSSTCVDENWFWEFGDGDTSSVKNPSHVYSSEGVFTVTLQASGDFDTSILTLVDYITVDAPLSADFTVDGITGCPPLTVNFTPSTTASNTSYIWDFGDGGNSEASAPSHTYLSPGSYTVSLVIGNACGPDTIIKEGLITVTDRPTIDMASSFDSLGSNLPCSPLEVRFFTISADSLLTFSWTFGDGGTSVERNPVHTYTQIGTYPVRLIASGLCGADTVLRQSYISITTRPIADFACPPNAGFVPFEVTFTDQSLYEPDQWSWNFGDGDTSNSSNPTHIYTEPGIYDVSLIASNACGTSTIRDKPGCVSAAGYVLSVDQAQHQGDTLVYPTHLTTVIQSVYPNPVYLNAALASETPYRGSIAMQFVESVGSPEHHTQFRVLPSGDLPTGTYSIAISAVDSILGYIDYDTVTFAHQGQRILALSPSRLDYDSVVTGQTVSMVARIVNVAPVNTEFPLTIQNIQLLGNAFSINPFEVAILPPDSIHPVSVRFTPQERRVYAGSLKITTNDPVTRDTTISLFGRGIPEQIAPLVVQVGPEPDATGILINEIIVLEFSEPLLIQGSDTTITVFSRLRGERLPGQMQLAEKSIIFFGDQFWPPFDTLDVRLFANEVTDTVYNRLDGDGDGLEEGSPIDDYHFTFVTGPGVYPGDTDDNRSVDERDVLPLGRFWERTGPARPLTHESFSMQPAYLWPDSAATYADADGNGVIDSTDVCPILEFWEIGGFAKVEREQAFWKELAALESDILRSIYSAIDYCPAQESAPALKGVLSEWIGESSGVVPYDFELLQNYPNPFNARTVITFTLPAPVDVELVVFNTKGERIAVLEVGHKDKGRHVVVWDGRTLSGHQSASGMYFYRLKAGDYRQTRKMTLLK